MIRSYLPIAVRAWTRRHDATQRGRTRKRRPSRRRWRRAVLILDTETTIDPTQRLLFGSYRYGRWTKRGMLRCVEEGLIYADDLPERDPAGWTVLQKYARTRRADVASAHDRTLVLHSRRHFLDRVFWPAAYEGRALVVGFNLPFDLSRLASRSGSARGFFRGGFSLVLSEYQDRSTGRWLERWYRPRLCIKHLDRKRAFIGFVRPAAAERKSHAVPRAGKAARRARFSGHFLDLKTLAFALTDRGHSLASAGEAFAVDMRKGHAERHGRITSSYIDYNRQDVRATAALLVKLRAEFDRHPIALDPCSTLSPAAIAKGYLRALRLTPPTEQFREVNPEVLGAAMTAYFGGRAECRIRCTAVPVVYCDFLSMYPTVNTLMRLWWLVTAARLEIIDATEDVRQFLGQVTVDRCFDPAVWRDLTFFAQIVPDRDVLPVRARYAEASDALTIGVNPLTTRTPLWFAGPDLVASVLLSGKVPTVLRAVRLVPKGRQAHLRSVDLRGSLPIDPRRDDFFRLVIEARKRLQVSTHVAAEERARLDRLLKVLANSGSYGIFAEMTRQDLPKGKQVAITVHGLEGAFPARTGAPEEPGEFCFPPFAALITAAARLMLAMLERCVTDLGSTYAFCDTDSMAIVATKPGGLVPCGGGSHRLPDGTSAIRALSWADVDAIVTRFAALNPYDRTVVPGSILKIEDENFRATSRKRRQLHCYAISAKRYVLFTVAADGRPVIRKYSEHGLGHLLDPLDPDDDSGDWIRALWEIILCEALGRRATRPVWLHRPALSRVTASSPHILRRFMETSTRRPYADQVKPFNFLLVAHVAPFGHPQGVDPVRFQLMAPYTTDPRQWPTLRWTDTYSGHAYPITTTDVTSPEFVRVRSYEDVLAEYTTHPEPKSVAEGRPCDRLTRGLLTRRSVHALSLSYIGKESNLIEEVQDGLVHALDEVQEIYVDPRKNPWDTLVRPILRRIPRAQLARAAGVSKRYIQMLRNGKRRPSQDVKRVLLRAAADYAQGRLPQPAMDDLAACAAYQRLTSSLPHRIVHAPNVEPRQLIAPLAQGLQRP